MFEKMNEIKVFRDPIHSYVKVEYKIIWDCINAREFHIETDAGSSWSLDGEYQEGCRDITITNLHSAIEMMLV